MTPTSCPIILACDERYAMPLATTLRSMAEANHSGRPLDLYVLTTGMPEQARRQVAGSLPPGAASVRWIVITLEMFAGFQTQPHISGMTYARLMLPQLFPGAARVLYLDSDILVLRDLDELCRTDLRGHVVGAVCDGMDRQLKDGVPGFETVPRVDGYFNAGVMLIDLERWRSEQIGARAMAYLIAHPRTPFSDQDALNVACDGRWLALDPAWNCQAHLGHHALSRLTPDRRPGIVHFVTAGKPWNRWVPNANAAEYDAVRNRTLFARTISERLLDAALGFGCAIKELSKRHAAGRLVYRTLKQAWRTAAALR